MPLYFFNLKDLQGTIRDPIGTDLPDAAAAGEHARVVAWELMQNRQSRTRAWTLEVCDGAGQACLQVLFASVDDSIRHLTPELRGSVERLCASSASFAETVHAIKATLCQLRGTIARSDGSPYLTAVTTATAGGQPRKYGDRMA